MFTTGETARLLGVTAQTVINWIGSGKLAAVRVGRGRRRIAFGSLRLFVEQNAIPARDNAPDLWERMRDTALPVATTLPAVFAIDGFGRIVFWNAVLETLLGWTAQEREGRSVSEIPVQVPGLPVDLADLAKEPGEEMRLSLHLEFTHKTGGKVPTETTLSWIRDAKGATIGTVFVLEPVDPAKLHAEAGSGVRKPRGSRKG